VSNYLTYKINDCWSLAGRAEWFQDPQGARVSAGSRGNYFGMTAGLNYKPHANVTIRPELRYDWFDGFTGTTAEPFNGGVASSQLSGGFDAVFTF
jgi:long-subunit fatty acid transport protein